MATNKNQMINTAYHAGVDVILAVGYSELGKKLLKRQTPKVDLNIADISMLTLYKYF